MLPPSSTALGAPHNVIGAMAVPAATATNCPSYRPGDIRITAPGTAEASALFNSVASYTTEPAGQPGGGALASWSRGADGETERKLWAVEPPQAATRRVDAAAIANVAARRVTPSPSRSLRSL